MRGERRKQILTLVILVITVLGISIGFSAYTSTLKIQSGLTFTPDPSAFNVKFSTTQDALTVAEVTPYSKSADLTATNGIIDNSSVPTISGLSAVYSQPGDYVTYRFYVRNEGDYIAYLESITFNDSKVCTPRLGTTESKAQAACDDINMTVTVGDVSVTETSSEIIGETLNPNEGKLVEVTVAYASDGAISDGDFTLEFGSVSLYYTATTTGGGIITSSETTDMCRVTSSETSSGVLSTGDEITCGDEQFYVMSADTETVTMLTKNPLSSAYPYKQAESTSEILYTQIFESSAEFEASMERDTNLVNPYLTHYKNYLSGLGYDANVRLITMDDWVSFGCTNALHEYCSSVPSWVLSNGYSYYSSDYHLESYNGVDYAYYYLFRYESLYSIDSYNSDHVGVNYSNAIRPVVTISTSDISS